jgi:hypothetical protein
MNRMSGRWERLSNASTKRRVHWRGRLNPLLPSVYGVISTVILFLCDILVGSRFDPCPAKVEEAMHRIPYFFGVSFIIFYLVQLQGLKSYGPRTMICNQCYRVKNEDREPNCSCGGQFEPLDNWEWVEDDHPNTETNANTEE